VVPIQTKPPATSANGCTSPNVAISPIHCEKMAAPYRPTLPSPAAEPPAGEGWVHEAKLDGFRCLAPPSWRWGRTGSLGRVLVLIPRR
jgi:hypothetical protein